jgi:RNA polymerase sigma-70 factor (family 1)
MRVKNDLSKLCDIDLFKLMKVGDFQAFTEIYNRYSGLLYVYSLKMIRDKGEAEDLVQDLFLSFWNGRESLEINSSVSAYLYAAVRYRFFDLLSRQKVRSDYVAAWQEFMDQGTYSTDDYINEKELIALVEYEVTKLPEKMRHVFELSRNTGMTHRAIAQQLNLSEKTVRNHINRALKILRLKLGSGLLLIFLLHH